jgi:NTE family protein
MPPRSPVAGSQERPQKASRRLETQVVEPERSRGGDTAPPSRIAIACQGGGSHAAFTAGVLHGLLEKLDNDVEIAALSGTSGGAISALLAWDGLLRGDRSRAIDQLQRFWKDNTASSLLEAFLNYSIQMAIRFRSVVPVPELSPYAFPSWGQDQLRAMLERRVDFAEARKLAVREGAPGLLVGAVNVLTGGFTIFNGQAIRVESMLASAAVPDLFPAVALDGQTYWDGLFAQNPPLRELTDYGPDEIWVIQVNKTGGDHVPMSRDDIHDRRNELAGKLSLEQEIRFIDKINDLLERGMLVNSPYRRIEVHRIALQQNLDYASKLDRSEPVVRSLMSHGRKSAKAFLAARAARSTEPTTGRPTR